MTQKASAFNRVWNVKGALWTKVDNKMRDLLALGPCYSCLMAAHIVPCAPFAASRSEYRPHHHEVLKAANRGQLADKSKRGKAGWEAHGMEPWAMPVYVPLGKEVTFWPEPSVRGKNAIGFGTSAVNVGGYTLPVPD